MMFQTIDPQNRPRTLISPIYEGVHSCYPFQMKERGSETTAGYLASSTLPRLFFATSFLFHYLALAGAAEPYQGKYLTHPEWSAFQQSVEAWRPDAEQAVALALGVKIPDDFDVEVVFEDFPGHAAKNIQTAVTTTVIRGGRRVQRILFRPELHFGHLVDIKTEILHEMTHAVLRGLLKERHKPVPKWVREGLAVWVARQGREKMVVNLASRLHEHRPAAALLNGLESPHQVKDYAEDFLAMDYLVSLGGPQAIRRFVGLLVEGRTHLEALEEASGQSWETFQQEAGRFAEVALTALFAEEHALHRDASRHYHQKRYEDAWNLYDRIVQRHTPFEATALYYRARCSQLLKRYTDAESVFASLLSPTLGPPLGGLLDEAAYHYAECARQQGLVQEATLRYERVIRDYPYSPLAAEARAHRLAARGARGTWGAGGAVPAARAEGDPEDEDSDDDLQPASQFVMPKPSKTTRELTERLQAAVRAKDFDTVKEELLRWDPREFEDGALETRHGDWKGLLPWLSGIAQQLPAPLQREVLDAWNVSAKRLASSDRPEERIKHIFLWPGALPVKQAVLAQAGLEAWDGGDAGRAWPLIVESRVPGLALLHRLVPSALEGRALIPPLAKKWTWTSPAPASPPSEIIPTPGWVWTILKNGNIWMIDDELGQPVKDGQGREGPVVKKTGSLIPLLLPDSRTIVLHNPASPKGFLNFIDLVSAESWNLLLPENLLGSLREQRGAVSYAMAPCSSPERLFLIETTPRMGGLMGQEMILHVWTPPQARPLWSKELGTMATSSPSRGQPPVILGEFGSQWIALHSERAVVAGNNLSGALEWIRELPDPEIQAGASPPPAPRSLQPSAKVGLWMEGDVFLCSTPSRRAVYALNRTDGTVKWQKTFPSEPQILGVRRGRVIISTHQQAAAYALEDGAIQWETQAPGAATRNGEGALFHQAAYLPWGNQVSVVNADSGAALGTVDRALTKWCTLIVTADRLYEFSDDGIAAWQSAPKK